MAAPITRFDPLNEYISLQNAMKSWKKMNKEESLKERAELENSMKTATERIKGLLPRIPIQEAKILRDINNQLTQCIDLNPKVYDLSSIFDEAINEMLRQINDLATDVDDEVKEKAEEIETLKEFYLMLNQELTGVLEADDFVSKIKRFPHALQRDQLYFRAAQAYLQFNAPENITDLWRLVQDLKIRQNIDSLELRYHAQKYTDEISQGTACKASIALQYLQRVADMDLQIELIKRTSAEIQTALRSACIIGTEISLKFGFVLFHLAKVMDISPARNALMLQIGRAAIKMGSPFADAVLPELPEADREAFRKELEAACPAPPSPSASPSNGVTAHSHNFESDPSIVQLKLLWAKRQYQKGEELVAQIVSADVKSYAWIMIAGAYLKDKQHEKIRKLLKSKQLPLDIQEKLLSTHTKVLRTNGAAALQKREYLQVVELSKSFLSREERNSLLLQIPIEEREKIIKGCFNDDDELIKEKTAIALSLIRILPETDPEAILRKDYLLKIVFESCIRDKNFKMAMKAVIALNNPTEKDKARTTLESEWKAKNASETAPSSSAPASSSSSSSSLISSGSSASEAS